MTLLELNLIGVPEVTLDGEPVTFARRGSVALLAYLALSRRAHPREALATLLAGDRSEEQARKHLSNVLVDLRQRLGSYVCATLQTVRFDWTLPHLLDVAEFHTRLEAGLDQQSWTDLELMIPLYRGEFLAGLTLAGAPDFDQWLFAQREELRGQYMQALRAQVNASMHQGDWSSGIALARRLIAEEPWLEEAHRQLMLMLARTGQRWAAIAQYHTCRRVLREELGMEPTRETFDLFNRLRAAMSPPRHNLPPAASPMVGRADEMRLLLSLLTDPDCRIVTLTGMGGSGKTRLALEVARTFATPQTPPTEQAFPDGIIFVSLSESSPPNGQTASQVILTACADALELPTQGPPEELGKSIAAYLRTRASLLVLDNLDRLQPGFGETLQFLEQAPYVKVLATSRTPLHLEGERVLHVDGLCLPASPADLETAEASALFLQEARRVQVGFALAESQRPHLVTLCRQLGGFPLALMLAARWAPVLPCSRLVRELTHGLDLLVTSESDLPERHRSVRAILDCSLAQLSNEARALAQTLAETSFKPDPPSTRPIRASGEMLAGLRSLSEQSLVWIDTARGTAHLHPLLSRYVRGTRAGNTKPLAL